MMSTAWPLRKFSQECSESRRPRRLQPVPPNCEVPTSCQPSSGMTVAACRWLLPLATPCRPERCCNRIQQALFGGSQGFSYINIRPMHHVKCGRMFSWGLDRVLLENPLMVFCLGTSSWVSLTLPGLGLPAGEALTCDTRFYSLATEPHLTHLRLKPDSLATETSFDALATKT